MTRFCALSGGSFTELPTNTIVLDEICTRDHLRAIFDGKLPLDLLPNVIHEATHHWCFFSAVGTTLTALRTRFQQRCVTETSQGPVFDDYLRFELGASALRPIGEGLALFAEFDVLPGRRNVRTPVLMWMLALFNREQFRTDASAPAIDRALDELLRCARENETVERKKESLLVKPLHTDDGGYLAGYLGVKGFWARVQREAPEFADAELVWSYLRSFFFEDTAFVNILLDPGRSHGDLITGIPDYIGERLMLLELIDLPESLAAFEADVSKLPHGPGTERVLAEDVSIFEKAHTHGLHVDEEATQKAHERGAELVLQIANATDKAAALIATAFRYLLARRHLMCIASAPAQIRVNEHHRVLASFDGGFISAPANEGEEPREAEGRLEIYYGTNDIWLAALILIDAWPVAATPIFGENMNREELFNLMFDRSKILAREEALNIMLDGFIAQQQAGPLTRELCDDVHQMLGNAYMRFALQGMSIEARRAAAAVMRDHGFWDIFEHRLAIVRAVANASVRQRTGADPLIQEAAQLAARVNFPLVEENILRV